MNAIVTVVGHDRVGIIAGVCVALAALNVNVLDLSQTVMQNYFTMIMHVDTSACELSFAALSDKLSALGETEKLSIRIMREDIFNAMHRI